METREHIGLQLLSDGVLLSMLGKNKSWINAELAPAAKHSIIPAAKAPLTEGPYLTIRVIADTRVGTNLTECFVVIRCYNGIDKTYIEIDQVLSRVKALLHRNRFTYDDGTVNVDVFYETTGGELEDEAYGQLFRESQYRIQYL